MSIINTELSEGLSVLLWLDLSLSLNSDMWIQLTLMLRNWSHFYMSDFGTMKDKKYFTCWSEWTFAQLLHNLHFGGNGGIYYSKEYMTHFSLTCTLKFEIQMLHTLTGYNTPIKKKKTRISCLSIKSCSRLWEHHLEFLTSSIVLQGILQTTFNLPKFHVFHVVGGRESSCLRKPNPELLLTYNLLPQLWIQAYENILPSVSRMGDLCCWL